MQIPEEDQLDKAYTAGKLSLSLIPYGSTVAEVLNLFVTTPVEQRRKAWMEHVIKALEKLEEKHAGIVGELAQNEEFSSLLMRASISAYKTHLRDKHIMFRNAIINSTNTPEIDFEIKDVYINFIDSLTLQHITVLKFIRDYEDRIQAVNEYQKIYNILVEGTIDHTVPRMGRMEVSAFRFLIKDLESKGLVFISDSMSDLEGKVYGNIYLTERDYNTHLPYIAVSDFGKTFLSFVETDMFNEEVTN